MSAAGPAPWWREERSGHHIELVLALHVQPGARSTAVAGLHGDALRVRVAAAPSEGKANAALVRFLADAFGVPQRHVSVVRGALGRHKVVRIDDPARRPGWLVQPGD